uniref:AMP-binding protein n=1 Tax=Porcipelethomonas sp. TaxID=2981675 RepID=UPI00307AB056
MDKKQIKENIVKIKNNGIKLWTEDGKLRFKAPKGAMNDEFLSFLKDNKADVIKALDEENGIVLTEDVENRYETFPLTDIQSAYLLGRRQDFAYGGVACHIYMEIKYNCEFDTERAAGVWQKIYEHHEMLHSVINRDGYQVILKNFSKLNVNCYDFEKTDNSGEKFSQIRRELSHKIYDTEKEPLFTVAFSKFTDKTIMHFSIEFIIADWMSIWTILSQFEELYFGKVQKLAEVDVSFRDYVISASKIKDTISYENDKEYWMKKIDSIPKAPALPLNINTDKNKYSDKVTFERKNMSLSKTKWDNFKSICGKFGITPTSAVMTAYAYVLERWSRNKKFSINMTVLNRLPLHENIGRVIGDFTSVDIVDVDMSKNESFIDYGKQVNKTLFENLDHRLFSGVEVIRELSRKKGGDYAFMPIVFTSAIGLINNDMTNLKGDLSYGISQTPQVFIDCQVMDGVFGLQVNWDVRKGVFEETVIDDMFSIFEKLLNDLSVSKENWEKNEALKLPQWQEKLFKDVNNTAKKLPCHLIHSKILECAAKTPDRIALADENGTVTYGDMIDKAEKLAAEIVLSGAMKNDIVAIIVEKSIDQIIAAIAALIAGCTYLPLDVTQGEKRRNYILEETKCKYLFSLKKYGFDFDKNIKPCIVYLDKFDYDAPVKTKEFPVADENSLAYIIYTSGSTGNPKGVAISHKAAVNTIEDINMRYNVTENDVVLNIAQLNFDLSVYDIFGLLSVGGTVVVPSVDKYTNPAHWKKIITKYKVSVWNSVPSFMQMFTVLKNETNEEELDSIRLVMLSGDWIPVSLPNEIMSMARNARIVSLGGATEASIWSIYHEYEAEDADKVSIPYGKPLYNQGYKVLDEKLNDCPVFTAGELYITGTGLADEYY